MRVSYYKLFTLLLCPATLLVGHFLSYSSWSEGLEVQTRKDGWLNAFFVKRGWFWTSLVGWWCAIRYNSFGRQQRHSLVRYLVLTVWWYVFTQGLWFGIAPIMDLIFTLTGGSCRFDVFDDSGNLSSLFHDSMSRRVSSLKRIYGLLKGKGVEETPLLAHSLNSIRCALNATDCQDRNSSAVPIEPTELNQFIRDSLYANGPLNTSATCRALGGHWVGGHDPSGHIFLITLMIMYLLGEFKVFGKKALSRIARGKKYAAKSFIDLFDNGALWNVVNNKPRNTVHFVQLTVVLPPLVFVKALCRFCAQIISFAILENPIILLVVLLMMWWWSFLVTSVVFHTLTEQISGLIFAYLVAGAIYWNDHWFIDSAMR
ncbi:hypothetical protein HG536_0H03650 [Torulaspora globosa]|uniref:Acyl-coenzyme A diphosphatase SCS3 n=1 Tax=Torulaspora globosa TaxID=48254 RepID=A0A7G3ZNA3_9SACH|nr:uncharacterized protein HG536_0H03650 [Torulaspora globosa]QLL34989.1 hypothetical protein HG536_0H03650 [Torulaspora globosa]